MQYAADLHIHTALSPCADADMTPNNIVNMAKIKGLDIISITDHNSSANLEAVSKCAKKSGLLFVPGMEVETAEAVHLVCLLPDLDSAYALNSIVSDSLSGIKNRKDIFGEQLILNERDEVIGEELNMLVTSTSLSTDDVFSVVKRLKGTVIPAHVDRDSYSMISNLGMIPEELGIKYLEISRGCDEQAFKASNHMIEGFKLIKSSDAHYLGDILERDSTLLALDDLTTQSVIRALSP